MGLRHWFLERLDDLAEEGLVPMARRRLRHHLFREGDVAPKLIPGEVVHDEARHHPLHFAGPVAQIGGASLLLVVWLAQVPVRLWWVPLCVCGGLVAWAWYRLLGRTRDLFVITDSRVFRINGVYTRYEGEMPMGRVLDIAVERPWYLRWADVGHLVLENAAQTQGLRDIRWITAPQARARLIHELRTPTRSAPQAPPLAPIVLGRGRADHPALRGSPRRPFH